MKTDRTGWASGPWDDEPDHIEWRAHGFPCLVSRGASGAWCGYVGIPPGHPRHGKDKIDDNHDLDVHGGITYSNVGCSGHICHVQKPGEPDNVHWIGFDCAHWGDFAPGYTRHRDLCSPLMGGVYRSLAYVQTETERLAEQLRSEATP